MDKHMEETRKWDALREGQQETETAVSAAEKRRNWNTIRTGLYTAIAVMLVMSAVMGSAWAYFTTYAMAKGTVPLKLGHQEHLTEQFDNWEKVLDIKSEPDSNPVYLRMRAYSADYPVTYEKNDNWTDLQDDGWVYYKEVLQPGRKLSDPNGDGNTDDSDELHVQIKDVPKSGDEGLKDGKKFNVIIVYESTEAQYNADGDVIPAVDADWERPVDTNRRTTTLGGDE